MTEAPTYPHEVMKYALQLAQPETRARFYETLAMGGVPFTDQHIIFFREVVSLYEQGLMHGDVYAYAQKSRTD